MAKLLSLLVLQVSLVVLSSSFSSVHSRPMSPSEHETTAIDTLGGIKEEGPSPKGPGHAYVDAGAIGGIKISGSIAGVGGHGYVKSDTLGVVKHSGPSPGGGGHKHVTALGGIKASGPSPKGGGHKVMTLGGIKHSMMRLGQ